MLIENNKIHCPCSQGETKAFQNMINIDLSYNVFLKHVLGSTPFHVKPLNSVQKFAQA